MACAMRSTRGIVDVSDPPLLQIRGLSISYPSERGAIGALRGIDLELAAGECLSVVGESGSGKTQLLLAILGLSAPSGQVRGSIRYRGHELIGMRAVELNRIRGKRIGMVFQDPMTALNPYLHVGAQITEVLRQHEDLRGRAAERRAIELLESLQMPEAAQRMRQYPHELSGGMRQRAMIAIALIARPEILLADEPSTALDVTVQAQVLNLFRELRERTGTAIVLVTHDLGVTAELADRVAVMYAGRVVEQAAVRTLFESPRHPYTEALQQSIPRIDAALPTRLPSIAGTSPDPAALPAGCAFAPRCLYRLPLCQVSPPALIEAAAAHWKACHYDGVLGKIRGGAA
jgi:oligopeptide/dipeptide ABC transporter ATP-binding protein